MGRDYITDRRIGAANLVTAIGRMGNLPADKREKIWKSPHAPTERAGPDTIENLWTIVSPFFTAGGHVKGDKRMNGVRRTTALLGQFDKVYGQPMCIALQNVAVFGRTSGFAPVSIIAKAILTFPTFPWAEFIPGVIQVPKKISLSIDGERRIMPIPEGTTALVTEAGLKYANDFHIPSSLDPMKAQGAIWKDMLQDIRENPYGGYRPTPGSGARIQGMVFMAKRLLIELAEDKSVSRYAGGRNAGSMTDAVKSCSSG